MPRKNYSVQSFYFMMADSHKAAALAELCEKNNIAVDFETGKGVAEAFYTYGMKNFTYGNDKSKKTGIAQIINPISKLNEGDLANENRMAENFSYAGDITKAIRDNRLLIYKDTELYPRPVIWDENTGKMELGDMITEMKKPKSPNFFKGLLHAMNKNWFKADYDKYEKAMNEYRVGNESIESAAETRGAIVGLRMDAIMTAPRAMQRITRDMAQTAQLEDEYAEALHKGKGSKLMETFVRGTMDEYQKACSYVEKIRNGHVDDTKQLSDSLYNLAAANLMRDFFQANDNTIETLTKNGVTKEKVIDTLRNMPELQKAFENMTEHKYVKLFDNPDFLKFGDKFKNKVKTALGMELPPEKESPEEQAAKERTQAEAAKKQAVEQAGKKLAGDAIKFQNFKKAYWWDTNADTRKEFPTRLDKMVQQADNIYKKVMDYTDSIQKGAEVKPKAQDLSASLYNLAAVSLLRDFYLEGDTAVEKLMETGLGRDGFVSALRKVPALKEAFDNMTEEKYVKLINSPDFMKFSDQVKEDVKISAKCMRADMQVQGKAAPSREQQLQKASVKKAKTAQQNQVKQPDPMQKG